MRPIVMLGTDFSETSLHAATEARRLSGALGGTVEVVHVREGIRRDPVALTEAAARWLDEAEVPIHALCLRSGTPWIELVRQSSECSAELIVVGTHGSTGFQPMALGSTAQRLALLSPRPVVLVGRREGGLRTVAAEQTNHRMQAAGEGSPALEAPAVTGPHHSTRTMP